MTVDETGDDGDKSIDTFDPNEDAGQQSGDDGDWTDNSHCVNPDGQSDTGGDDDSYDFSIIWIANSSEGTVSKVDTREAREIARYRTGPTATNSPSRTSVSLRGHVAVANRGSGTVVKIAARPEECKDLNGDGEISTSTGPNDVLRWGEDECVMWTNDLGFQTPGDEWHTGGPRALAWEPGVDDPDDPCALEARLWVGWRDQPSTAAKVRRINADGSTDDEVEIPMWQVGEWGHALYGGAADVENNFWAIGSEGVLIRVDADDLSVEQWQREGSAAARRFYGMVLDGQGTPWISTYDEHSLVRFDRDRERFVEVRAPTIPNSTPETVFRGLVVDEEYQVWIAGNNPCGIARYDIPNERWHDEYVVLPECQEPVGVSVDYDGFVWVVDRQAALGYKLNRDSLRAEIVRGFETPYTYSDMTGSGLKLVTDKVDPPGR